MALLPGIDTNDEAKTNAVMHLYTSVLSCTPVLQGAGSGGWCGVMVRQILAQITQFCFGGCLQCLLSVFCDELMVGSLCVVAIMCTLSPAGFCSAAAYPCIPFSAAFLSQGCLLRSWLFVAAAEDRSHSPRLHAVCRRCRGCRHSPVCGGMG